MLTAEMNESNIGSASEEKMQRGAGGPDQAGQRSASIPNRRFDSRVSLKAMEASTRTHQVDSCSNPVQ